MQVLTMRGNFLYEFGEARKTGVDSQLKDTRLKGGEMTKEEREALLSYPPTSHSDVSVYTYFKFFSYEKNSL